MEEITPFFSYEALEQVSGGLGAFIFLRAMALLAGTAITHAVAEDRR